MATKIDNSLCKKSANMLRRWMYENHPSKKVRRIKRKNKKRARIRNLQEQYFIHQQDMALTVFWDRFKNEHSFNMRLAALKEYAEFYLAQKRATSYWRRRRYRRSFDTKFGDVCMMCRLKKPDHFHHVISLAHGGDNADNNFVELCESCHSWVHGFDVGTKYKGKVNVDKNTRH